jgi:hypothetical protein
LVKSGERQLLFLNAKYNAKVTKYDVIKAPRAVPVDKNDPTEGKIDMKNGKEITDKMYAIKQKIGDKSLNNYYGYQKVKYADGSPLIAEYDSEGNPVYVYKFINLHGDGMYATEYYGDGRPSVFNNGSEKNVKNIEGTIVSNEIPDQVIVDYYGGENVPTSEADVITSTIENETSVAPTQAVSEEIQNEGSIVYYSEDGDVGITVGSDREGYVNVKFDGTDEIVEVKKDELESSSLENMFEASYFVNLDRRIGDMVTINNAEVRLLDVQETEYEEEQEDGETYNTVKFLKAQSKSGRVFPIMATYNFETNETEFDDNPTDEDLGISPDMYDTEDFQC